MTKLLTLTDENIYVQTFLLFTQVADATIKYMDNRFYRNGNLSFIKYSVLRALLRNGGTMNHSDIAKWTNTKKHNITSLIDRMMKDKLVTTEWSTIDRRVNNVTITDKGRELYKLANPLAKEMVEQLMRRMKETDVRDFEALLDIVKKNIERIYPIII